MTNNDLVEEALKNAHIPNFTMYSTLAKMGLKLLRDYVKDDVLVMSLDSDQREYSAAGLYLYSRHSYQNARKALAMVAKEMVLVGHHGVEYTNLSKMIDYTEAKSDEDRYADLRYIFIADFYSTNTESPFTGRSLNTLQSLIMDWVYRGISVSVSSDSKLEGMDWYSESFRSFLKEYFIVEEINNV